MLSLTRKQFDEFGGLIAARTGLEMTPSKKPDIERALTNSAEKLEVDAGNLLTQLIHDNLNGPSSSTFINELTIGETYFFREQAIFEGISNLLFQNYANGNDGNIIRIWSAGCASGEEPYSAAIAACEFFKGQLPPPVKIFATDINHDFLKRAKNGFYRNWSFRNIPGEFRTKYFRKSGSKEYSIIETVKQIVSFEHLNLVDFARRREVHALPPQDAILCRNVLMYFAADPRRKILEAFYDTLKPGGWLFLGLTELGYQDEHRFEIHQFANGIGFKKPLQETTAPAAPKQEIRPKSSGQREKKAAPKAVAAPVASLIPPRQKAEQLRDGREPFSMEEVRKQYENGRYAETAMQISGLLSNDDVPPELRTELPELYLLLAKSYAAMGEMKTAKSACLQGLGKDKLNHQLYFCLSVIYQDEDQLDLAADALLKAVYLKPDYIAARFALANIYRRRSKTGEAVKQLNLIMEMTERLNEDMVIGDTDGLTAGKLSAIVRSIRDQQDRTLFSDGTLPNNAKTII